MLCLENWYYRILLLMTGYLKNVTLALDALSICVRVANELGAGNGKAAKFATKIALIFTSNTDVLKEVDKLSYLLAISVIFNSVQPVLSGVAVGSGWQAKVAYINLGCYYLVGLPLGFLLGWFLHWGVMIRSPCPMAESLLSSVYSCFILIE
ncbi:hypothetical protein Patl1_08592 [Pistacia atlantica]|uniref:Uncharacterized protein n=1 Tax=Pistacia atlantica TaxID=434234 RepID=A0ACC1AJZ4_9ROSI|nr:hypothetical protein Patl1_08592 [Pistacia atlantica]